MKYSSSLLTKYIKVNDSRENIANNLILKTVEIEEVVKREISPMIVIGKVMECVDHPDSDHMHVCQVNCWNKGNFQIVCWAENVAEWLMVAVALEGTVFEKAGITIAKRKLRWVDSNGMICSKWELGIGEDLDKPWIWDLKQDLEMTEDDLWKPLTEKFPRLDTVVLDVDNKWLTNRPDLTGHFGVAWELNAMYQPAGKINFSKLPDIKQSFDMTNIFDLLNETKKKWKKQIISETQDLNTYILLEINDIEVKKSDFFMRLQCLDLGFGGVNNWVDFGNLWMNITGQPVHFFDADKVDGNIIVRNAKDGETFIDLFGKEHKLVSNDVLICDEKKILCLGWVMWGENSWITGNTKNILVEIANFNPVKLRKTGVRLGLRTDSELRNEKNINPVFSLFSLLLFLDEVKYYKKDLGNFEIGGVSSWIGENVNVGKKAVVVDWRKMDNLIFGGEMTEFEQKAQEILKGLGFEIFDKFSVVSPIWRWPDDMNIAEDIAEEVARIWGYEEIKSIPANVPLVSQRFKGDVARMRKTEQILVEKCWLTQVETYPWVNEGWNLTLQNPVNPECPVLRDSFIYQFMQLAKKNSKFFDEFKIFDIGKVWMESEELMTGMLLYKKSINKRDEDCLLEMKGIVETLLSENWIDEKPSYQGTNLAEFHPKKQADIYIWDKKVGKIWALHPMELKNNKLPENASVCFAEISLWELENIINNQWERKYLYETEQDQILWRDLSFIVDEESDFWSLLEKIKKVDGVLDLEVFDVFRWGSVPEGKKSISLKFKIKWDGGMTSEMIGQIMDKAIQAGESAGGKLRG